jgi:hypothetical protein
MAAVPTTPLQIRTRHSSPCIECRDLLARKGEILSPGHLRGASESSMILKYRPQEIARALIFRIIKYLFW